MHIRIETGHKPYDTTSELQIPKSGLDLYLSSKTTEGMIQQEKDVLMRWLKSFFEALSRISNHTKEEIRKEIDDTYVDFFKKERHFLIASDFDEVIEFLQKDIKYLERIRPLCELLYQDALQEDVEEIRTKIYLRIRDFILYHQTQTKIIIFEDIARISELEKMLEDN